MSIHSMTTKELMELPEWDFTKNGDFVCSQLIMLRVPGKHESGYSYITTIGELEDAAYILGTHSDAIHLWGHMSGLATDSINMDCLYPSGAFRIWISKNLRIKYTPMSDAMFDFTEDEPSDKSKATPRKDS